MKIFNWMRGRFNDEKDNVKQHDNGNDNYKQPLMNNDTEFDDQWKGSLLTIGTFGLDPHHKNYLINQQPNEYSCPNYYPLVDEYEVKEEEEEESNDVNDDDEEYSTCITNDFCDYDQSESALIKMKKMDNVVDALVDQSFDEIMVVEKKERITLADLFKADSAEMEEKTGRELIQKEKKAIIATPPPGNLLEGKQLMKKKQMMSTKSIKQISQPVQKLLKRMLKRKIHPELEGRAKSCAVAAAAGVGVPSTKREIGAHDTISLVQIPHGINSEVRA